MYCHKRVASRRIKMEKFLRTKGKQWKGEESEAIRRKVIKGKSKRQKLLFRAKPGQEKMLNWWNRLGLGKERGGVKRNEKKCVWMNACLARFWPSMSKESEKHSKAENVCGEKDYVGLAMRVLLKQNLRNIQTRGQVLPCQQTTRIWRWSLRKRKGLRLQTKKDMRTE